VLTVKTIAAVVGAFATVVAAIALAAAAIAAFAATAAANQAEFAFLAFVVAAVAFVVAVVAALVWIAADACTENAATSAADSAGKVTLDPTAKAVSTAIASADVAAIPNTVDTARAVIEDAAPAAAPDQAPADRNEEFNQALRRKVYLGWWNRDLRPKPGASPRENKEIQEFDAERKNIQLGLELRYSLLELATRRLTESLSRTGLRARAPEPSDYMIGNVTGAIAAAGVRGNFELKGRFSEGGNIPDAPEQLGDREFSLPSLSIWQLATIDVFVEKAQYFLTTRINQNERLAHGTTVATLAVMLVAIIFGLSVFDLSPFFQSFVHVPDPPAVNVANNQNSGSKSTDWETLLFVFLGNTTLLGLLLGIAYFFASLTRAFLHEATILKNRRHSVRLGRLVLHMKVSSARSPEHLAEIIAALNINDLEQAFGWNLDTSTAFKDINPEAMTTSLTGQLLASLKKVSDSFASDMKPG